MPVKGKIVEATDRHQQIRDAIVAMLRKEGADMAALEMLAVLSQTLGQMIAFQDQRLGTEVIMELVSRNIEIGNRAAIEQSLGQTVGSA